VYGVKVGLRHFIDEEGNEVKLTAQAKTIFKFLTKIVMIMLYSQLAVSK